MPLTLKLEPGQKVIINGAVIENTGSVTSIAVHNKANILRSKDVLTDEQATTPARRVYYSLQCAYLFEDNREEYMRLFEDYLREYVLAAPSAEPILAKIRSSIAAGNYYAALRTAKRLFDHEKERIDLVLSQTR